MAKDAIVETNMHHPIKPSESKDDLSSADKLFDQIAKSNQNSVKNENLEDEKDNEMADE